MIKDGGGGIAITELEPQRRSCSTTSAATPASASCSSCRATTSSAATSSPDNVGGDRARRLVRQRRRGEQRERRARHRHRDRRAGDEEHRPVEHRERERRRRHRDRRLRPCRPGEPDRAEYGRLERRRRHHRRGRRPHRPEQHGPAERRLGDLLGRRDRRRRQHGGREHRARAVLRDRLHVGVVPGAPETWIIDTPGRPRPVAGQIVSRSRNASFTYMGSDETTLLTDLTFECRLDSTDPLGWEDCDYPAEYFNLSAGPAHLRGARDRLPDPSSPTRPRRRTPGATTPLPAGVAPRTFIDLTPPAETWLPDAHLHLPLERARRHLRVQVDALGWEPCGFETRSAHEPGRLRGRARGDRRRPAHLLRARDRLRGQRRRAGPATVAADGRPRDVRRRPRLHAGVRRPRRRPGDGRPDAGLDRDHLVEVNVADATFECQLDLEPYAACDAAYNASTVVYSVTYTGLTVGDHCSTSSRSPRPSRRRRGGARRLRVGDRRDARHVPPDTTIELAPGDAGNPLRRGLAARPSSSSSGTDDLTPDAAAHVPVPGRRRPEATTPPVENAWVECLSPFNLLDAWTPTRTSSWRPASSTRSTCVRSTSPTRRSRTRSSRSSRATRTRRPRATSGRRR